jgi:hypothetical protein
MMCCRLAAVMCCSGVVEPVAAGVEAGVRLGVGKQQEDDKFTAAEGIARKKLEVELQADEDPERTKRREVCGITPPYLVMTNLLVCARAVLHMLSDKQEVVELACLGLLC